MDSKEIEKIIAEMNKYPNNGEKAEVFGKKYPEFKEKYEKMFEIACTRQLELDKLRFMLKQLEKMQNNELDQHQASVKVGQKLYDQYVEPKIRNLPPTKKD